MRKIPVLAGSIVLLVLQACAPAAETGKETEPGKRTVNSGAKTLVKRTVSFAGLTGLVYDPCDTNECGLAPAPNDVKAVRAIAVDSRYASPGDRKDRSSHHPYIVGANLTDLHAGTAADEWFDGMPAWSIRGKKVQFKKGGMPLDGPVSFDQRHISQMSWTAPANRIARVWDWAARTTTGAIVQLNGGTLAANFDAQHRWKASLADHLTECKSEEEVTEQVRFVAVFDEIVVTEGNSSTVVLRFQPPAATIEIAIRNHPTGGSAKGLTEHFKEFYDMSDPGYAVPWANRCNTLDPKKCVVDINGNCQYPLVDDSMHMVSTKTAFCPPVVFEKR